MNNLYIPLSGVANVPATEKFDRVLQRSERQFDRINIRLHNHLQKMKRLICQAMRRPWFKPWTEKRRRRNCWLTLYKFPRTPSCLTEPQTRPTEQRQRSWKDWRKRRRWRRWSTSGSANGRKGSPSFLVLTARSRSAGEIPWRDM